MPLAECHNQDNKRVVSDGTKRVSKTTGKKVVQWKDVIVEEKIIEKYESSSEEESEPSLPSPPPSNRSSMARRDTIAPSALYSTRSKGLRRLTPSPNPLFDSEHLQNQKLDGCRVRAVMKTELVFDGKTKMPATRFSTPLAVLDLAPPTSTLGTSSGSSPSRRASTGSSLGQTTPAMRRSTETIDSRRSSSTSSSSSMASPRGSLSPSPIYSPSAAPSRFAVSGTIQGVTRLEAGLEGVYALLEKTRAAHIKAIHVQTADPVLADIVGNMNEHMRTEFATFAWPRLLTDRVQEILRKISVETIMVDVTIEYVPEKEGLFRRFSHQIKSVFNFIRSFR